LDVIDKKKHIKKRFYRDCCKKQNGVFYKDLKHLKKMIKMNSEMILIDDNTVSVGHNYPFAIKIK
jgi:TFIIF-interacting CTD phosphatase-like protein